MKTLQVGRRTRLRIGRNALARLLAQVGSRLVSLVLVGVVTRYTGSAGLGRYVVISTVLTLVAAVTDFGLGTLLIRDTASASSQEAQRELLGQLLPVRLALAALGAALLVALSALPVSPGMLNPQAAGSDAAARNAVALLAAAALLPRAGFDFLSAFVNGRRRFDVSSSVAVAVRVVGLAGSMLALLAGYGVAGAITALAAADLVGIVIYERILRAWDALPRLSLQPAHWTRLLRTAYPFALTGIIGVAYRRLDVLLLGAWQGDAAAGQYGAAHKLAETAGLVPASLLDAAFPEMASIAAQPRRRGRLGRAARRAAPLLFVGGVALSAVGTILAAPLVRLVYGRGGVPVGTVPTFRVQLWTVPAMFLYLLNGHLLYALGRQRRVTSAMALVAVVNVALNLLVIPRWSALGVSAVSLVSGLLLWLLLAAQAHRALRTEEDQG